MTRRKHEPLLSDSPPDADGFTSISDAGHALLAANVAAAGLSLCAGHETELSPRTRFDGCRCGEVKP